MAQLEYIRLDTDFFDKPKIKGLVYRHGHESVGFLLRLLCSMGRATEGFIGRDAWEAIGIESGIDPDRAEKLVAYCLDQGILDGDLSAISNSRVHADQDALDKKRGAARERVRTHRQKPTEVSAPAFVARMERAVAVVPNNSPVPSPVLVVPTHRQEPTEEFDTDDPNLKIALEKLEQPAGQPWTNDNRHISAGRRPMRDYPSLWLTPPELADVVKKLEESQIPVQSYKDLFLKAEARLKTYSGQGRSTQGVSVYNWMTGFLFDELLERTIKETRLAKTMEGPQRYEQRR
jgi:hypothetical protein